MNGLFHQDNRRITFAILKARLPKWGWTIGGVVYLVCLIAVGWEWGRYAALGLNGVAMFGIATIYFIKRSTGD